MKDIEIFRSRPVINGPVAVFISAGASLTTPCGQKKIFFPVKQTARFKCYVSRGLMISERMLAKPLASSLSTLTIRALFASLQDIRGEGPDALL